MLSMVSTSPGPSGSRGGSANGPGRHSQLYLGAEAANKFKDDNDVVVVAYQDDATVFVAVADSIDDYQFGLLDADAAAALNVEKGQIVLFKDFDDNRVDFDSDLTHDDLSKFIKSEALPLGKALNPKISYFYHRHINYSRIRDGMSYSTINVAL